MGIWTRRGANHEGPLASGFYPEHESPRMLLRLNDSLERAEWRGRAVKPFLRQMKSGNAEGVNTQGLGGSGRTSRVDSNFDPREWPFSHLRACHSSCLCCVVL